jgi:2-phospho-L-lactate guanylyltransferase
VNRDHTTCVVIPMKAPQQAKTRLIPILRHSQRESLALRLFKNTLAFFRAEFPQISLLVVTPCAQIADLTRRAGYHVLLEDQQSGLNAALRLATSWTLCKGFERQLIIPADIACLNSAEIRQLLDQQPTGPAVTLVPSGDGGTNALLCSPPDAIPFAFGKHSASRHLRAAENAGLPCQQLALIQLQQDIDQPQDLPRALFPMTVEAAPYV